MNITKEMAHKSLRPTLDSYRNVGNPTDEEVTAEQARLSKNVTENEKKVLHRQVHPANTDDIADEVEALKTRLAAHDTQIAALTTRISTLEGRKNT